MSDYAVPHGHDARRSVTLRAHGQFCLQEQAIVILRKNRGQWIGCDAGFVWVTMEGDTEDHVLQPNEQICIAKNGKVIISGDGCFELSLGPKPGARAPASHWPY
jgi:hypothetical protein